MNTFWEYFWPLLAVGSIIGVIAGLVGFRKRLSRPANKVGTAIADDSANQPHRTNWKALAAGASACIIAAAIWHGPLGAARRFATEVDSNIRVSLTSWEMPQIHGHIQHDPLTRRVILSGKADDFQRDYLARIIDTVPGVSGAAWSDRAGGLPLIVEGAIGSLLGFLLGLMLAYLFERHRRYNAQWNW